jgi:hypothetical protein
MKNLAVASLPGLTCFSLAVLLCGCGAGGGVRRQLHLPSQSRFRPPRRMSPWAARNSSPPTLPTHRLCLVYDPAARNFQQIRMQPRDRNASWMSARFS